MKYQDIIGLRLNNRMKIQARMDSSLNLILNDEYYIPALQIDVDVI